MLAGAGRSRPQAQNEQFIPGLVYRTGAYAPNGMPFANGVADYINLVNARDGGINGVKITFEECETGYATDRGVECYERLKGKGPTGAAYVQPAVDRHHLRADREGAGRQDPAASPWAMAAPKPRRRVFTWNFPLLGTYWTAADVIIQHIAKEQGGFDKLKGKKIALRLSRLALRQGADRGARGAARRSTASSSCDPGRRIRASSRSRTWLQIRQQRPDYVLLWGWGVMNSDRRSTRRAPSTIRATR